MPPVALQLCDRTLEGKPLLNHLGLSSPGKVRLALRKHMVEAHQGEDFDWGRGGILQWMADKFGRMVFG